MNLTNFRPMKSATPDQDFDFGTLFDGKTQWMVSPKVDGIRCVIHPELGPVTNTLKPIKNTYIREWLIAHCPKWLDGELVVLDKQGRGGTTAQWGETLSGIMSEGGRPDFRFRVFDYFEMGQTCTFGMRNHDASEIIEKSRQLFYSGHGDIYRVSMLEQLDVDSLVYFESLEAQYLSLGYEGLMIRRKDALYKKNRSTLKEGGMIKVKRYTDAEAKVVGWEPLELNRNEPQRDLLGLQRRTSHKDGRIVDDTRVGSLSCTGINGRFAGVSFSVGSGFDDALRVQMREAIRHNDTHTLTVGLHPDDPRGKILTYKYQDHGSIDAPRQPIFKGFRHPDDVSF
jgi:DNA ligase-1